MLIIPLTGKGFRQNLPVVTIAIILVNCLVYFVLQAGDPGSLRYGLTPARPSAATVISYMFLHGSLSHLLGNMIFLWIMGCLIEAGCGRAVFVLEYLLGGVLSAGLYCLVYSYSRVPLVGASGAIAALMGIFTVLYGRRRIKIFYSLGVYFSTVTIPAIVVLPLWIGNEVFQLFFSGTSHVAYVAHLGGLLSGALMGAANRLLPTPAAVKVPDAGAEPQDRVSPLMEQALDKITDLELPAAEKLLEEVLLLDARHPDALRHLFHIRKLEPQTRRFQSTAGRLIALLLKNPATQKEALAIYGEYRDLPGRPPLPAALYLQITLAFIGRGRVDEAEKLLAALIRKRPDFPGISTALFKLAAACRDRGLKDRWQRYRRVLCTRFPESDEARMLRQR